MWTRFTEGWPDRGRNFVIVYDDGASACQAYRAAGGTLLDGETGDVLPAGPLWGASWVYSPEGYVAAFTQITTADWR